MDLSTTYMGFRLPHPIIPAPRRCRTIWMPFAGWKTLGRR